MNFGSSFLNWIKTFYTNISSCVVNNGYSSEFFSLQRGVRQGCPLSGLLFVLAVEPLAHQIRINESIKGLENGNKITKLSMYVDDTTAFIRDDSSAVSLLTLLDQFGDLSGLKINGPIYTRDGSSVWDEFGQRTIVRLIIRLRINTGKQTDHPSRRSIWIIRLHRRITGDNSSERIIRL